MRAGLTTYQEDPDPNLFATEVRNCAGSSVTFEVWSAKVQTYPVPSLVLD